ncbi:MAG: hypothetical protein E8D41_12245 [Nitrospira sp.]|nr:MAG: hypothetical protein E8D41_12245 [Nitrospira sp.]
MTQWNIIHFMNATQEQQQDPHVIAKCETAYNAIKPKRAEVIEAALSVEGILDQVLLDLLVGRDAVKRARFTELILAAEFCTSFQKWKMLSRLMAAEPAYFMQLLDGDQKTLRNEIHALIEDRNKFAHGDLIVNVPESYAVDLRYYESGTKFLRITDQVLNELLARALRCRENLWKLHSNFGTDLKTAVF